MAQTGFTPIQLYYSSTSGAVPLAINLVNGELAINTADKLLYAKDSGGAIFSIGANRVVALADATSVTFNADTTDIATQANTQAIGTLTINAPTGTPSNGQKITFRLRSTNIQTFSWNAIFQGSTDVALPSASSGSGKYDYMGFIYNSTAVKWQLIAKNFGF
jgi:hypothetical protein